MPTSSTGPRRRRIALIISPSATGEGRQGTVPRSNLILSPVRRSEMVRPTSVLFILPREAGEGGPPKAVEGATATKRTPVNTPPPPCFGWSASPAPFHFAGEEIRLLQRQRRDRDIHRTFGVGDDAQRVVVVGDAEQTNVVDHHVGRHAAGLPGKGADRGGHAFFRVRGEGLKIDRRVFGERPLQVRHRGLRRLAKQPECRPGLNIDGNVGETQDLLPLIEHRLAPHVYCRVGTEREKAALLYVHQKRNQQPVAGSGNCSLSDGGRERAGAVLG